MHTTRDCRKNGVLQSGIEATEISTRTGEINDQVGKIKQSSARLVDLLPNKEDWNWAKDEMRKVFKDRN